MNAHIGSVALRLRTGTRSQAEHVAREFRGAFADAFGEALKPYVCANGVTIVPRLRVTLTAPLGRIGGRELARRIARGCIDAIAAERLPLVPSPEYEPGGTAERTLRALSTSDGVRVEPATEAATWLVALARDEPCVIRYASPYADLATRPMGAAFLELCARSDAPRDIIAALGRKWAHTIALRCSPAEATSLIRILDDGSEPDAATWRQLLASLSSEKDIPPQGSGHQAREVTDAQTSMQQEYVQDPGFSVRVLAAALEGLFDGPAGIIAAARAIISSRSLPPENLSSGERRPLSTAPGGLTDSQGTLRSEFTGFWLLLPHLAECLRPIDEPIARAVAFAVAERICGETAASDPAIVAFMDGKRTAELRALVAADERIDRLTVRVVRRFAQSVMRFERARCGYILRAFLRGSGEVRRTSKGWVATLPRSPLRIVLERAALLGEIQTPWDEPVFEFVREV